MARPRAPPTVMTHQEFVRAYEQGAIQVRVDRAAAARLLSARLLLPLVLLPVLGASVALALAGYLFTGIALFLAGVGVRFLVRATSNGFVLNHALQDAAFYEEVKSKNILVVNPGG
ncbi:MAG TPA: hypothetical protein VIQ55_03910 [Burkholderiales bacterium]|jgi:hypothetical protein